MFSPGIGIDISDHHLRLARLSWLGRVRYLKEVTLPEGLVVDDHVVDGTQLKNVLYELLHGERGEELRGKTTVLVPESRIFSSHVVLPKKLKRKAEDTAGVLARAQQDIPLPFHQAITAVEQGARVSGGVRTTVYASPREVISGLEETFVAGPFDVMAMEANTKGLFRLFRRYGLKELQPRTAQELTMVVDIGNLWTTIALYTPSGSSVFSRTIRHRLEAQQAELAQVSVDRITAAIKESVLYFTQQGHDVLFGVLAGVEATQPQVANACMGVAQTVVLRPIGSVLQMRGVDEEGAHIYGAALGAALRSIRAHRYHYQHNFLQAS